MKKSIIALLLILSYTALLSQQLKINSEVSLISLKPVHGKIFTTYLDIDPSGKMGSGKLPEETASTYNRKEASIINRFITIKTEKESVQYQFEISRIRSGEQNKMVTDTDIPFSNNKNLIPTIQNNLKRINKPYFIENVNEIDSNITNYRKTINFKAGMPHLHTIIELSGIVMPNKNYIDMQMWVDTIEANNYKSIISYKKVSDDNGVVLLSFSQIQKPIERDITIIGGLNKKSESRVINGQTIPETEYYLPRNIFENLELSSTGFLTIDKKDNLIIFLELKRNQITKKNVENEIEEIVHLEHTVSLTNKIK